MKIDEKLIEEIVRKVISEQLPPSTSSDDYFVTGEHQGVKSIDAKRVVCEKFPFKSERVYLKDVLDTNESPRLGCGVMEMDSTSLDWTLHYDEIDYVIEGTLQIIIDGKIISASQGELVYIPKGSTITFQAEGKTRFLYVVYPANWAEQ